jgi:hypothetical protein
MPDTFPPRTFSVAVFEINKTSDISRDISKESTKKKTAFLVVCVFGALYECLIKKLSSLKMLIACGEL